MVEERIGENNIQQHLVDLRWMGADWDALGQQPEGQAIPPDAIPDVIEPVQPDVEPVIPDVEPVQPVQPVQPVEPVPDVVPDVVPDQPPPVEVRDPRQWVDLEGPPQGPLNMDWEERVRRFGIADHNAASWKWLYPNGTLNITEYPSSYHEAKEIERQLALQGGPEQKAENLAWPLRVRLQGMEVANGSTFEYTYDENGNINRTELPTTWQQSIAARYQPQSAPPTFPIITPEGPPQLEPQIDYFQQMVGETEIEEEEAKADEEKTIDEQAKDVKDKTDELVDNLIIDGNAGTKNAVEQPVQTVDISNMVQETGVPAPVKPETIPEKQKDQKVDWGVVQTVPRPPFRNVFTDIPAAQRNLNIAQRRLAGLKAEIEADDQKNFFMRMNSALRQFTELDLTATQRQVDTLTENIDRWTKLIPKFKSDAYVQSVGSVYKKSKVDFWRKNYILQGYPDKYRVLDAKSYTVVFEYPQYQSLVPDIQDQQTKLDDPDVQQRLEEFDAGWSLDRVADDDEYKMIIDRDEEVLQTGKSMPIFVRYRDDMDDQYMLTFIENNEPLSDRDLMAVMNKHNMQIPIKGENNIYHFVGEYRAWELPTENKDLLYRAKPPEEMSKWSPLDQIDDDFKFFELMNKIDRLTDTTDVSSWDPGKRDWQKLNFKPERDPALALMSYGDAKRFIKMHNMDLPDPSFRNNELKEFMEKYQIWLHTNGNLVWNAKDADQGFSNKFVYDLEPKEFGPPDFTPRWLFKDYIETDPSQNNYVLLGNKAFKRYCLRYKLSPFEAIGRTWEEFFDTFDYMIDGITGDIHYWFKKGPWAFIPHAKEEYDMSIRELLLSTEQSPGVDLPQIDWPERFQMYSDEDELNHVKQETLRVTLARRVFEENGMKQIWDWNRQGSEFGYIARNMHITPRQLPRTQFTGMDRAMAEVVSEAYINLTPTREEVKRGWLGRRPNAMWQMPNGELVRFIHEQAYGSQMVATYVNYDKKIILVGIRGVKEFKEQRDAALGAFMNSKIKLLMEMWNEGTKILTEIQEMVKTEGFYAYYAGHSMGGLYIGMQSIRSPELFGVNPHIFLYNPYAQEIPGLEDANAWRGYQADRVNTRIWCMTEDDYAALLAYETPRHNVIFQSTQNLGANPWLGGKVRMDLFIKAHSMNRWTENSVNDVNRFIDGQSQMATFWDDTRFYRWFDGTSKWKGWRWSATAKTFFEYIGPQPHGKPGHADDGIDRDMQLQRNRMSEIQLEKEKKLWLT